MYQLNTVEIASVSGGIASFMTGYVLGSKDWDPLTTFTLSVVAGFACHSPFVYFGPQGSLSKTMYLASDCVAALVGYGLSQVAGLADFK